MPTPRAGAAVAVLGKQILVVGGVGEDQSPLKVVEVYNTEEGRWRKRSALREALMGVSITVKGTDKRKQRKLFLLLFVLTSVSNSICLCALVQWCVCKISNNRAKKTTNVASQKSFAV